MLTKFKSIKNLLLSGIAALSLSISNAQVSSFEDLYTTLGSNLYWTPSTVSSGFSDGEAYFPIKYATYWSYGWAYSAVNNTTLAGYSNQFAAITGTGKDNSKVYAVCYDTSPLKLISPTTISGFYATNTTYAYLSMKNGDSFAKKFGGTTGTDPDYFKLIVKGYLNKTLVSDTAAFFLADFTSDDATKDYIVNTWKWVDLAKFGVVDSLVFSFQSSDVGAYGINTPVYFAMDDFNAPKPLATGTISEIAGLGEVSFFPNPATDVIHIAFTQAKAERFEVNVLNIDGKLVQSASVSATNTTIDVSALPVGVYFVNIRNAEANSFSRFVKE